MCVLDNKNKNEYNEETLNSLRIKTFSGLQKLIFIYLSKLYNL